MIEIVLRITDSRYAPLQKHIAALLEGRCKVATIDDSSLEDKFRPVIARFARSMTISRDIREAFRGESNALTYFRISRVFEEDGRQCGWYVPEIYDGILALNHPKLQRPLAVQQQESLCILDTDIASGGTRDLALRLFPGAAFFAPIVLGKNQDLIDVEDLFQKRCFVVSEGKLVSCNYLLNAELFCRLTSLTTEIYDRIIACSSLSKASAFASSSARVPELSRIKSALEFRSASDS
jgi:hypothetical protein